MTQSFLVKLTMKMAVNRGSQSLQKLPRGFYASEGLPAPTPGDWMARPGPALVVMRMVVMRVMVMMVVWVYWWCGWLLVVTEVMMVVWVVVGGNGVGDDCGDGNDDCGNDDTD